jgi:uncharacterized protein (DUF2336 family)
MFSEYRWILYVCLLGIVGSAAVYAAENSITGGSTSMIAAAVLAGTFALFLAVIVDLAVERIVAAVTEQRMREGDIMIAEATGKAVYKAIKEEQDKK